MNTDNNTYNPADDDNQGVVQVLAQSEASNTGVPQDSPLRAITASGPEPEKAEVADPDGDSGINDDLLAEETVEKGEVELENEE